MSKTMTPKKLIISFILILMMKQINAQNYEANWESLDARPVPEWFKDAKFGIFIHWGVYSVPSWAPTGELNVYAKYAEWYWKRLLTKDMEGHDQFLQHHLETYGEDKMYQDFAPGFTAEMFNPEAWADLFENAGAKYVVLTSKHHEGFTLWPSQESWNWNAVDIGPHRDLAGDLTAAVKAKDIHMGFYYSLYEWFNPQYHNNLDAYVEQHMIPQMKDLVVRYEPDIIWPDGEWDHPAEKWKSKEFLTWLYNDSPVKDQVVVNDRWGEATRGKHGGYYTTEYGLVHDESGLLDAQHPWEECRGIGGSFGYNRNENLNDYQTSQELVHLLVDIVAKGGNLLLNIGPTADGRIPVIMQQRLTDMGNWLKINGEAIYGSRPYEGASDDENIVFTRSNGNVYAIAKTWPGSQLKLNNINARKISLVGSNQQSLSMKKSGSSLTIDLNQINHAELASNYAYVFKLEGVK